MTSCFNILWIFFLLKKAFSFFRGLFERTIALFSSLYKKKSFEWKPLKEPSSPKHCQKKKGVLFVFSNDSTSSQLTPFSNNKDSLRCGLRSWSVDGTYQLSHHAIAYANSTLCQLPYAPPAHGKPRHCSSHLKFLLSTFFCLLNFPIFSSLFSENFGSFIFFLCFFLYSLFLRSVFMVLLSQEERGETKMSNSKCPSFRKV